MDLDLLVCGVDDFRITSDSNIGQMIELAVQLIGATDRVGGTDVGVSYQQATLLAITADSHGQSSEHQEE